MKISPLRPNMVFTDTKFGSLTKEAYDFLYGMFVRIGGSLDALNAATLENHTWEEPGTIGSTTPSSGAFTTVSATGQITSTLATGTAPFAVSSTTVVPNLNVSKLLGGTWAVPGTIGSTTPNSGAFTTLSATGNITGTSNGQVINFSPTGTGTVTIKPASSGNMDNVIIGNTVPTSAHFTVLTASDISGTIGGTTTAAGTFTTLTATGAFGCNGQAAQTAYSVGAAVASTAATNTTPYGYTTAAQANDIVTKLNAVITALKNNGIIV